jgi:hypothetical protein
MADDLTTTPLEAMERNGFTSSHQDPAMFRRLHTIPGGVHVSTGGLKTVEATAEDDGDGEICEL